MDLSAWAARAAKVGGVEHVLVGSAVSLPFRESSVQVVCCLDVIEHLADPAAFFADAWRVMAPGGVLVISTPNPESLGSRLKGRTSFIFRDPTHRTVLRRGEWRRMLQSVGFDTLREGTDTLWDPPYVHWLPHSLQRLAFLLISQVFWAWQPAFAWSLGENFWWLGRKPGRL